jgi:hypothetical protein
MTSKQEIFSLIYGGAVESRLEYSRTIAGHVQPILETRDTFRDAFQRLQKYANELNRHMSEMDLGSLCSSCAAKPTGGCCSLYMSGETDAVQMSLNILAGLDVRVSCKNGRDCVFLGDSGCIFLFKPMFCLNYNCSHIHKVGRLEDVKQLEQYTGQLLSQQYELEQHILKLLEK